MGNLVKVILGEVSSLKVGVQHTPTPTHPFGNPPGPFANYERNHIKKPVGKGCFFGVCVFLVRCGWFTTLDWDVATPFPGFQDSTKMSSTSGIGIH